MGQGKLTRYVLMLLFVSAITCMVGFWWARSGDSASWKFWALGLKWTLITLAACGAYMAFVGLYHTILAALGLDGQPALFSKGERSGPISSPHSSKARPSAPVSKETSALQ